MDLMDIYKAFEPKTTEYIFFSSARGTLSKRDHMLGQKTSLSKLKETETVSNMFSNNNTMRL